MGGATGTGNAALGGGAGAIGSGGALNTAGTAGNGGATSGGGVSGSGAAPAGVAGGGGGLVASGGATGSGATGGGAVTNSGGASGIGNAGGGVPVSAGGTTSSGGVIGSGGLTVAGGSSGNGGAGGFAGSGSASSGGGAGGGGPAQDGQSLFTQETFGGNGRTCVTCHTLGTGTINPSQIQALYSTSPTDPMFRPIDSDDGTGSSYTQLLQRATVNVTINLPSGVHLLSDPTATSITLRRAIPTTINTPALDPNLMWDGREPNLLSQAQDAIAGHAQGTIVPTMAQLGLIASFEKGFFSSDVLKQYAAGGAAPTWPAGNSDSEKRGRRWFVQSSDPGAGQFNFCGQCHGGPMTNETQPNSGIAIGQHFQSVDVAEFNLVGNPTYQFTFPDPKHAGQTIVVATPDPGRALVTGSFSDVNFFKIPPLWGVRNTAPYFHDNSAATLNDVMTQYKKFMATFLPSSGDYPILHVPNDQDTADIIAFLNLL